VEFRYKCKQIIIFFQISSETTSVVTATVAVFDVSPHGLYRNITYGSKCWNAWKKLVRHWHFHLYLLIIPLPIKVAQHHNALLSFWQRTSRKKGLHIILALNAENGFLKFKAKK